MKKGIVLILTRLDSMLWGVDMIELKEGLLRLSYTDGAISHPVKATPEIESSIKNWHKYQKGIKGAKEVDEPNVPKIIEYVQAALK